MSSELSRKAYITDTEAQSCTWVLNSDSLSTLPYKLFCHWVQISLYYLDILDKFCEKIQAQQLVTSETCWQQVTSVLSAIAWYQTVIPPFSSNSMLTVSISVAAHFLQGCLPVCYHSASKWSSFVQTSVSEVFLHQSLAYVCAQIWIVIIGGSACLCLSCK